MNFVQSESLLRIYFIASHVSVEEALYFERVYGTLVSLEMELSVKLRTNATEIVQVTNIGSIGRRFLSQLVAHSF